MESARLPPANTSPWKLNLTCCDMTSFCFSQFGVWFTIKFEINQGPSDGRRSNAGLVKMR